jgi:uncharacterized membrane protein
MMDRGRLEAFSDGVFAVAITLLALNLGVTGPEGGPLARQLVEHWPVFASYVVSFFTIGIIWVNHHALFSLMARLDRAQLFWNLLLLMFVVAIPFATSTLADYLRHGSRSATVAGLLYAGVMEGMSLSFTAIFVHALRAGLLSNPPPPEERRRAVLQFGLGAASYVVAMAAAFVSPILTLILAGILAGYYVFQHTPDGGDVESA